MSEKEINLKSSKLTIFVKTSEDGFVVRCSKQEESDILKFIEWRQGGIIRCSPVSNLELMSIKEVKENE